MSDPVSERFASLEPPSAAKERILTRVLEAMPAPPGTLTEEWVTLIRTRPIVHGALLVAAAALLVVVTAAQLPWGLVAVARGLGHEASASAMRAPAAARDRHEAGGVARPEIDPGALALHLDRSTQEE